MTMKYLAIFSLSVVLNAHAIEAPPPVVFTPDYCAVPAAVPGDGIDDRAAIQAALTTKGCAYLPAGVYDIDTPGFVPPARRIYDMLDASGATLFGDGPETVLHFRGDAGGQDWHGIRLTGLNPSLHGVSIDTKDLVNTVEQTHSVSVLGPTENPLVFAVSFNHPQRGEPGGDCVQLVGYPTQLINGGRIYNNEFNHCDRSGVAIHSGTNDFEITFNHFYDTGDQDIDAEGTGGSQDWLIAHNIFDLGPHPQGNYAIQFQANAKVRVTENTFNGRGIFAYGCSQCEIDHNTIVRTTLHSIGVIEVEKDSAGVNVHHNSITRSVLAGPGTVFRAIPHSGSTPAGLTFSDNVVMQENSGDIVNTTGVVGLIVERNTVAYTGAAAGGWGVLANGSAGELGIRTDQIEVNDNIWNGPLRAVIAISGSYAGAGSVKATGNTASVRGISCSNISTGAMILGPIAAFGNSWLPSSCGSLVSEGN